MSLRGKAAIVTGSTSGIGLGIARALAASGVQVVRNGFGAKEEIEKIRAEIGALFLLLCSEAGDNITGAALSMDGGGTAPEADFPVLGEVNRLKFSPDRSSSGCRCLRGCYARARCRRR